MFSLGVVTRRYTLTCCPFQPVHNPNLQNRCYTNHEGLITQLSQFSITLQTAGDPIDVSQDLANLLSESVRSYDKIVKASTLVIYGIRNKLFHGNYRVSDVHTQWEIEIAERVLRPLLRELIATKILGYALPQVYFVTLHKTGI